MGAGAPCGVSRSPARDPLFLPLTCLVPLRTRIRQAIQRELLQYGLRSVQFMSVFGGEGCRATQVLNYVSSHPELEHWAVVDSTDICAGSESMMMAMVRQVCPPYQVRVTELGSFRSQSVYTIG